MALVHCMLRIPRTRFKLRVTTLASALPRYAYAALIVCATRMFEFTDTMSLGLVKNGLQLVTRKVD